MSTLTLLERLGGQPRELWTFMRGNTVWRYTSGAAPITVATTGLSYVPALISRGRIQRSTDAGTQTVECRVSRRAPIADAIREIRSLPLKLRIDAYQLGDETVVPTILADGDVMNPTVTPDGWITFDLV